METIGWKSPKFWHNVEFPTGAAFLKCIVYSCILGKDVLARYAVRESVFKLFFNNDKYGNMGGTAVYPSLAVYFCRGLFYALTVRKAKE
jgi:hypothetical protein